MLDKHYFYKSGDYFGKLSIAVSQIEFKNYFLIFKWKCVYFWIDYACVPQGYALRVAAPNQTSTNAETSTTETGLLIQNEISQKDKYPGFAFKLYPNPTANALSISSNGRDQVMDLTITDLIGNIVHSGKVQISAGHTETIQLDLNSGVYFVNLISAKQTKYVKKLIISN